MKDSVIELVAFKKRGDDFIDHIDRIKNDNNYKVTKAIAERAKAKVRSAIHSVSGLPTPCNRVIDDKEIREILYLIFDLSKGKRRAVQFQLTDCETGIEEVFSGKVFYYK